MKRLPSHHLDKACLLAVALQILFCPLSSVAEEPSAAISRWHQAGLLLETLSPIYKSPAPTVSSPADAAAPGAASTDTSADLEAFVKRVSNGEAEVIRGVFVPGQFALPVIQQPRNNVTFVSNKHDLITQFGMATRNGVTGLLAHNYLSGRLFYQLAPGQDVFIIYGDSSTQRYRVSGIHRFQKLDPSSLRSNVLDLSTGEELTVSEVFTRFYRGDHHVTFQTCLEGQGRWDWGLTFVLATPVDSTS